MLRRLCTALGKALNGLQLGLLAHPGPILAHGLTFYARASAAILRGRNCPIGAKGCRIRALGAGQQAPKDFVVHSLRHTYGTRLGEAGADAFTIMKLMGHSSVTVSQRYVHPTPRTLESAVRRLEMLNQKGDRDVPPAQEQQLPATVSATVVKVAAASH